MTADEAARHLHMSSEDVRDLVARGDLAGRQTRDGMRLNRPDVEAYAARSGGAPGTEQHTS
jgi:excisionase family DNA binding protein